VGRGDGQAVFERAVADCRLGERCEFTLGVADPDFLATLVWAEFDECLEHPLDLQARQQDYAIRLELEVCDVRSPKARGTADVFDLPTAAKQAQAEALKAQADGEFKQQNVEAAIALYTKAYKLVFFEDGAACNDLKFRVGSNLAFMHLKAKKFEQCIGMNDQLIKFGYPVTDKTFFRNGQAAEGYGRLEEAVKFYERAIEASRDADFKASVAQSIAAVKKKVSDKKDQVRRNMQKMWGN
jgi:tetratricopeptide (TPR) repeat protein